MTFVPAPAGSCITRFHRNLPHWSQQGAIYFVTFRLADSLPHGVLARFKELSLDPIHAPNFAWLDRYLDAGTGSLALSDRHTAAAMAGVLRHFDGVRYQLGDFVIMPNHVHLLVRLTGDFSLAQVVHSWKSYSAKKLPGLAALGGRVWQHESFDRLVRDEDEMRRFQSYILENPAAAGIETGMFWLERGSL